MDVISEIRAFNAGREQERLQLKFQKMRVDAFSFLKEGLNNSKPGVSPA